MAAEQALVDAIRAECVRAETLERAKAEKAISWLEENMLIFRKSLEVERSVAAATMGIAEARRQENLRRAREGERFRTYVQQVKRIRVELESRVTALRVDASRRRDELVAAARAASAVDAAQAARAADARVAERHAARLAARRMATGPMLLTPALKTAIERQSRRAADVDAARRGTARLAGELYHASTGAAVGARQPADSQLELLLEVPQIASDKIGVHVSARRVRAQRPLDPVEFGQAELLAIKARAASDAAAAAAAAATAAGGNALVAVVESRDTVAARRGAKTRAPVLALRARARAQAMARR